IPLAPGIEEGVFEVGQHAVLVQKNQHERSAQITYCACRNGGGQTERRAHVPGRESRGTTMGGGSTLTRMASRHFLGHDADLAVGLEHSLLDRTDVAYAALAQVGKKFFFG